MFFNRNTLKKLMKETYKNGLDVGMNGKLLFLGGRYWEIEMHTQVIPKETMGDIISLIGELPREGEYFSAKKDGLQEILPRGINPETFRNNDLVVTNTLQTGTEGTLQRILQDCTNGNVYFINEVFMCLMKGKILDGETQIEGPYADAHGVLFRNNACMLHVYFRVDPKNEHISKSLETVNLMPEVEDEEEAEIYSS